MFIATHALVQCLGQLGRIVKFMFDSPGVVVKVNGRRWHLDPLCLTPAPGEQLQDEESKVFLVSVQCFFLLPCSILYVSNGLFTLYSG